ncbi:unnamed protein product [Phytophthora fragariaefolia]|uniref:Unnamed protein product n=1 Tax=Phytophthora fragariaefolia TaxID=1490495 RepID=A0A9W6UD82_9STRA|nr:unnamed protein product [Phytophthora fragariaefolia]
MLLSAIPFDPKGLVLSVASPIKARFEQRVTRMEQGGATKESATPEGKTKNKDRKKQKQKEEKSKKTRRRFREDAENAQTEQAPEILEVKPGTEKAELTRSDSATSSLSPSAIVEMFHLQDDEHVYPVAVTAVRYLVENEISGDFYHVRARQRKQQTLVDHAMHRRSSLAETHAKIREGSSKTEFWACWAILQRDGEKAVIVMVLGIMAGMSWMDALNLRSGELASSTSAVDHILCAYSASSNRSRQNLFLLIKYPKQHQNALINTIV